VTKKSETVEYFENETFLKKMFRSKIVIVKKKNLFYWSYQFSFEWHR